MKQAHNEIQKPTFQVTDNQFQMFKEMLFPFQGQPKLQDRILRAKVTGRFNEYTIFAMTGNKFAEIQKGPEGMYYVAIVYHEGDLPYYSDMLGTYKEAIKFIKEN